MNWIEEQNIKAEIAAAHRNAVHQKRQAADAAVERQHLHLMQALLYEMYAEDLEQRLEGK